MDNLKRAFKIDRVVMFSDGVFAIVITLLVLEISTGHGDAWNDFKDAIPELGVYAWSFFLVARFWTLHMRLFDALKEYVPEEIVGQNHVLLFFTALTPFATTFYSNHFHSVTGLAVYAAIMAIIGFVQVNMRRTILKYAKRDKNEQTQTVRDIVPFIIIPTLLTVSIPLAFVNPKISYVFWGALALQNIVRGILYKKGKVEHP